MYGVIVIMVVFGGFGDNCGVWFGDSGNAERTGMSGISRGKNVFCSILSEC